MSRRLFIALLMLASMAIVGGSALADEPSLHQVYQTAETGKLTEAQAMMHQVLSSHPNSAKAHFVEAELLAKQGQLAQSEAELATAERLAPGLPFANPQAVQALRSELGSSHRARPADVQQLQPLPQAARESSAPWGLVLFGVGLIAFLAFAARFMTQRNALPASNGNVFASPSLGTASGREQLQPYAGGSSGPFAAPVSGIGSRIVGGLATGAAVGAGIVASEALMRHFVGGREQVQNSPLGTDLAPSFQDDRIDDLGGADFGVTDSSSWDDSSSSEWN